MALQRLNVVKFTELIHRLLAVCNVCRLSFQQIVRVWIYMLHNFGMLSVNFLLVGYILV